MLEDCMTVKKESDRNNKRKEIFLLDCFVAKTGPVTRLAILDVADVEQRTQVHGWVHARMRSCSLWRRCHGRCA